MIKVLKFWAQWCNPCNMMKTSLWPRLVEANSDVFFEEINVDDHQNLVLKYQIEKIPAILVFKDDVETGRIQGLKLQRDYQGLIDDAKTRPV